MLALNATVDSEVRVGAEQVETTGAAESRAQEGENDGCLKKNSKIRTSRRPAADSRRVDARAAQYRRWPQGRMQVLSLRGARVWNHAPAHASSGDCRLTVGLASRRRRGGNPCSSCEHCAPALRPRFQPLRFGLPFSRAGHAVSDLPRLLQDTHEHLMCPRVHSGDLCQEGRAERDV